MKILLALSVLFASAEPTSEFPAKSITSKNAALDDAPQKKTSTPSQCVTSQDRVRFVSGYDHLVDVKNGCPKDVVCKISTNVNPEMQTVEIDADETKTVLTFRGSPAREFKSTLSCKWKNADGTIRS